MGVREKVQFNTQAADGQVEQHRDSPCKTCVARTRVYKWKHFPAVTRPARPARCRAAVYQTNHFATRAAGTRVEIFSLCIPDALSTQHSTRARIRSFCSYRLSLTRLEWAAKVRLSKTLLLSRRNLEGLHLLPRSSPGVYNVYNIIDGNRRLGDVRGCDTKQKCLCQKESGRKRHGQRTHRAQLSEPRVVRD